MKEPVPVLRQSHIDSTPRGATMHETITDRYGDTAEVYIEATGQVYLRVKNTSFGGVATSTDLSLTLEQSRQLRQALRAAEELA